MTQYINIKRLKNNLKDILFPVRCPYCQCVIDKNEYACDKCKKLFPTVSFKRYSAGGYLCAAAFPYDGVFAASVKRFKFSNRGGYAKQLAFPIAQSILETHKISDFDVITCVPMHKTLLKKRRYNQAELLARECAEILNIPYADTLEKYKMNKAQHSIKAAEREKNVRGVYRALDRNFLQGKSVLIIDDIITTGHTLGECSRILMKSGCKYVACAVLCTVTVY